MASEYNLEQQSKQMKQAILLSIGTACFLTIAKFITGFLTHSMSIMASALDSAFDMLMSGLNFFALREASKPPDEEHPYGHGKIESLAGLFQSLFIGSIGVFFIVEAIKRFFVGDAVYEISLGIWVIAASCVITLLLSWRLTVVSRKSQSMILATETAHYTMDLATHLGVIVALVLVKKTGNPAWDLAVSILVAAYILKESFEILSRAVSELLDKGLSRTEFAKLRLLILRYHPSIVGVHNLRSRLVAGQLFLDFHIEIRGEDDFKKAHQMTEDLIAKIKKQHPMADVVVHFDPEGENE